ncbi:MULTISPECIES: type II toxin-antitoxin system prevent-host-death family antitoxin [Cycloclasticus]|uniref:Prevent-host-death family protein n=1 Tax=Cycloclasticus pugetii TaxID=34068 RepID=A0AB33Z161_9GAMM|nr:MULTISPECIES: type II toxin-antitoxin system prevent-host-death family antitoxin [Cycloclasticus]ATI02413.1 type II toxin-antitoxin system prevent-host-death family antitoxin [Cycloclasticus sp. PY97N]EPD12874.1 prevent-host-death family protein [Cycloclasticus pugetii]
MITANDLKIKGISCLEDSLTNQPEVTITVRGKDKFVVMKIEQYHYLREMELEAALYEAQKDHAENNFTTSTVNSHVEDIFN